MGDDSRRNGLVATNVQIEVCMGILLVLSMIPILHWVVACILAILLAIFSQVCITFYVAHGDYAVCGVVPACSCSSCSCCNDESQNGSEKAELSYRCFFTAFSTALLIVAPPLLISLIKIPVSTLVFIEYLEATGQILILVIGLLVTYKIFCQTETESEIFMKAFKDTTSMKPALDTRD